MGYRIDFSSEPKKVRGKLLFTWVATYVDEIGIETVVGKGNAERLDQVLVDAGNLVLNHKPSAPQKAPISSQPRKSEKKHNIVVAGSRSFKNYKQLCDELDKYIKALKGASVCIISGGARGADELGEEYAKERGYELKVIKAQWEKYGKSAGFIRNSEVLDYLKDNGNGIVFAFWDTKSSGTKHIIENARKRGIKVKIFSK